MRTVTITIQEYWIKEIGQFQYRIFVDGTYIQSVVGTYSSALEQTNLLQKALHTQKLATEIVHLRVE